MEQSISDASKELAKDPVCGMTVDPQKAAGSFEYEGKQNFFCSVGCLEKFKADPNRFLSKETATPIGIQRAPTTASRGTSYTCPMHPEVLQNEPGSCPKCGMALEPVTPIVAQQKIQAEKLRAEGQTVMFVTVDGSVAGLLGVADPIKETTAEAISQLHEQKIKIVMLTGDSRTTAQAVANELNIDEMVAEVLPNQKAKIVKRFQSEGRKVAMAGDGINDAPALAQAQVGIAMGTGTDVAMQSAEGDLRGIVRAIQLSRATMRNIKQNLFFAFVYNSLGVPLAFGVLYPFFGLLLSPMIAAAAMSFSSVSVIGNALRLRRAGI